MLIRSAAVRFGLVYAALFGLSALALAVFLWWSTAGLLERQTEAAIGTDAKDLLERYNEGGIDALDITIQRRLMQNVDDDALYLLTDPSLQPLAGNLEQWPPNVSPDAELFSLKINRAGVNVLARVRQVVLFGGFRLLVGRDIAVADQVARLLTGALLWGALIVLALAVAGAVTVRSLFRRTLADVSATAAAIGAGDLGRRVPRSGSGDELDLLAETINDMLDRIGRLMDGVRHVSNAIAHDLRTPIARARVRLEDAARPDATEAELRAAIERAQADLDGVVRLFQALLRISEIESGSRRSAFAPLDQAPLLYDLADLYEAAAEERGQVLERAILAHLPSFGDRDMIQQAVANLLDNALKFSPEGGTVRLEAVIENGGVRVMVSDHGPGIPEADRDRASERFFRGESARNTAGYGLGLALVQAVATLHGGTLRLEDNAPGLRAVLTFPPPPSMPYVKQTSSQTQVEAKRLVPLSS
jgi:signal transduction histidine kinase